MQSEINLLLRDCQSSIDHITSKINDGSCNFCRLPACKEIPILNGRLKKLVTLLKNEKPSFASGIENKIVNAARINPYDFGAIIAMIGLLKIEYSIISHKKIFISHSSKDVVVEKFVEQILRLGCGLQTEDIVCTSIESTGIHTGQDIRNYLQKQIKACDYVFFMISANYMNSSICLNEMGASWALNKKVKPFLFPNLDFNHLGWLYEISKGSRLNDGAALDTLHDDLLKEYGLIKHKSSDWNRQKNNFSTDCFDFQY